MKRIQVTILFLAWCVALIFGQTVPTAPLPATPANNASGISITPTLTWGTVAGASTYRLQVSSVNTFATLLIDDSTLTAGTRAVTGLTNNKRYYWRALAKGAGGTSGWSSEWMFTTNRTAFLGPFTFTMSTGNASQVVIQRSINPSINGVQVSHGDIIAAFTPAGLCVGAARCADTENILVYIWGDDDQTPALDGAQVGDSLLFRVYDSSSGATGKAAVTWIPKGTQGMTRAYTYGANSFMGLASLVVTVPPDAPTLVTPARASGGVSITPTLSWGTVVSATGYRVQLSASSTFASTIVDDAAVTLPSQAISSALDHNTSYYWRVCAANTKGSGPWSAVFSFTTIPIYPLNVSAIAGTIVRSPDLPLYDSNTVVQLTVTPAGGCTFAGWSGDTTSTSNSIQVTMKSAKSITANFIEQNVVPLSSGWNLFSLNVKPQDSSAAAVFGSMKHVSIVKSNDGLVYMPAYGINTLGTLHFGQAYQIFTAGADTIKVPGSPVVAESAAIPLNSGWNMLAYLPKADMPVTTVFAGIVTRIKLVKNNEGELYWPSYGINDIGTMHAGKGYMMNMKSGASLTFPGN